MAKERVQLQLAMEEALVLLDWLDSRPDPAELGEPECRVSAIDVVLIRLEGQLETMIPALFERDYEEQLAAAVQAVEDSAQR